MYGNEKEKLFFPILSFISTKLICFFLYVSSLLWLRDTFIQPRSANFSILHTSTDFFCCSFSFFKYSRIVFFLSDFQPFFLTMVVVVVIFFKCPVHYTHYSLRFTEFCLENVWQPLCVCARFFSIQHTIIAYLEEIVIGFFFHCFDGFDFIFSTESHSSIGSIIWHFLLLLLLFPLHI